MSVDKNSEDDSEYVSYNGMNRPALFMGVPLMPMLFGCFLMVFGGFAGLLMWGGYGLIFPAVVFLCLFVLKLICEDDPNAMEIMTWRLKGAFLRLKQGSDVLVFVSGDEKSRESHAKRFFKKAISDRGEDPSLSV